MRKLLLLFVLVITIFMNSCTQGGRMIMFDNDQEIMDKQFHMFIDYIGSTNSYAIESMFSLNAIVDTEKFKQNLDELFNYYSGKFLSAESILMGEESIEHGERKKTLFSSYDVKTTEGEYRFCFSYVTKDTIKPENIGIWSIYVIKMEDDTDPELAYWGDLKYTPGINIGVKSPAD